MLRNPSILLALAASLPLSAQQVAAGYGSSTTPLPPGSASVLSTSFGRVYFDGFDLMLEPSGVPAQSLLTFPSYTFGSFSAPIGATAVLFGESSNGGIWSVPLNGLPAQLVANVPFNYDAVLLDDDRALVSAKTGGFSSPDNDVVFVDLLTGQTQLVAQFGGASGPLAIDANGDVYYATAPATFPAPAGTVSVLRLARAVVDNAIANNLVLGAADATVVIQGLDAAGDMAFDDDGDLFYVDWFQGRIGEIDDADGAQAALAATLIDYAGTGLSGSVLQFRPNATAGAQVLEPFQPSGGALIVHETDYVTVSQLRTVEARQPQLSTTAAAPIPAGSFALDTTAGPANGIGLLLFAATTPGGPVTLTVPGFEQPLLVDAALVGTPVIVPLTFDATGAASLTVTNPGFSPALDAIAQTVVVSTGGALGASSLLSLQVGP
ncbi:MAG: hypothetical protein KAI24_13090 [Planctomycetes bacterium]|nr:hypothetical protein [Planctomycetota bacterium]